MLRLYSILLSIVSFVLPISGWFSKKMHLFVQGRKNLIVRIRSKRNPQDNIVWIHAASLGEYEHAVPIMHSLRKEYPSYKIWLTFFSPSGYEIKKNTEEVDYVSYMPLDTIKNAKQFIEALNPTLAIFVKYEIWPNFLKELENQNIPSVLIAALFRPKQSLFKYPNSFRSKALRRFSSIGVQNNESLNLLNKIGYTNAILSGDTRFDRVIEQTDRDNQLDFLDRFCSNARLCIVCGSTWGEDEDVLLDFIQSAPDDIKFVIAPHQIQASRIARFRSDLQKPSSLWSEHESTDLEESKVFILDTIGYLGRAYAYASIAYVGGAIGSTGLHNILEPATFSVPVLYGRNTDKHPEAEALAKAGGGIFVSDATQVSKALNKLTTDEVYRRDIGKNAKVFIQEQAGATEKSLKLLQPYLNS